MRKLGLAAVAGVLLLFQSLAWQQNPADVYPLPEKSGPLRKAMLLLRESKTAEARKELEAQRKQRPNDAEVLYQIARSYLLDFYRSRRRNSAASRLAWRWKRSTPSSSIIPITSRRCAPRP